VPRVWTEGEITALSTIAKAAESEIVLRLALKDAEQSRVAMRAMLERVPYALFTLDREWNITFANEKAESVLGSTNAERIDNSLWSVCPHVQGTELELQLRLAMSAPGGSSFEGSLAQTGSWYEVTTEPSDTGLTVFFKDVSARRRADEALRDSERRYRFVFEEGLTCNVVTSPDGRIFACNQATVSTFGFTSVAQTIASSADGIWRESSKRAEMLDTLRTHGRFGPQEIQAQRMDGTPLAIVMSAVARFEKGALVEIHACMLDITEQKQLQAQFLQAQKMEAVGQLAGGMAHDFNNLLTVIKAYVQLSLGELDAAAPLRADMMVIGDAADRAAELTRQLLAFSRQQVLLPQRINLHTVITDIAPMIRTLLGPELNLLEDTARAIPDIEADRSQIEQVLMNLVVNARDAMPAGGTITFTTGETIVTPLSVDAHDGAPPGSYVTLAVRDTGTGMTPATAAQIFEPFFTTKDPGKGTGLGLSTVYGIVKQSGGHVTVSSAPGAGTTFTILLPAALPIETTKRRVTSGEGARLRAMNGKTVLVVDEDAPVRRALVRTLSRAGYIVLEAATGDAALRLAKAQPEPIDLLVSDVEMAGMLGRTLAERMRAVVPGLPVLLMSGYSDSGGAASPPSSAPQYHFVAKPFTADALTAAARAALASVPA